MVAETVSLLVYSLMNFAMRAEAGGSAAAGETKPSSRVALRFRALICGLRGQVRRVNAGIQTWRIRIGSTAVVTLGRATACDKPSGALFRCRRQRLEDLVPHQVLGFCIYEASRESGLYPGSLGEDSQMGSARARSNWPRSAI